MLELVFLTFYEFKFNVCYILNKILVNYIINKNKCGETEWVLMDAHYEKKILPQSWSGLGARNMKPA